MAAVFGMPIDTLQQVCNEAAQGEVVSPANINSPDQIVISGHQKAVERATELAKQRGAKRAIMLSVSAPFHCALMQPAQDRLAAHLGTLQLSNPGIPVINNIDAEPKITAEASPAALIHQLPRPVHCPNSQHNLIHLPVPPPI